MDELSFPAFLSWQGQQLGVLIYLLVVQTNTIVNACGSLRLGACSEPARWPKVAVLVPARNEEATIAACIRSLVRQDYPNFTLWTLDDQSTDRTGAILADEAAQSAKLHILSGQPLPVGWVGKTWACHQLAAAASGDLLFFVDSDTWHHPRMVRDAVAMLLAEDASLLSVVPRQVTVTVIERLTVPLIPWSLLTHFPVVLAQRFKWRLGAVALGQILLMRRHAYEAIGGHASVRREVAEDLALARAIAAGGMRWRIVNGTDRSSCRMYRSASAVREGFGRNIVGTFGRRYWVVAFVWSWLAIATIAPPLMLLGAVLGGLPFSIPLAAAATLLSMSTWVLAIVRHRLPVELVLLYPLVMAFALLLALESLRQSITRQSTWRGRQIA